jgi:hypothetical protein
LHALDFSIAANPSDRQTILNDELNSDKYLSNAFYTRYNNTHLFSNGKINKSPSFIRKYSSDNEELDQ